MGDTPTLTAPQGKQRILTRFNLETRVNLPPQHLFLLAPAP
jgi:hypothetical protein